MAIDARIEKVTYENDGTATLHLAKRGPLESGPGQPRLSVLNPPRGLDFMAGECIWGGATCIMYGNTRWAEREGYTRIRINTPSAKENQ